MKVLVTGACGFVGSTLIRQFRVECPDLTLVGCDNLSREGAELNRPVLRELGVRLIHGDLRSGSDVAGWPAVDWVIDAAANPSVLAGLGGGAQSRQLVEHNLGGTVNVLEFCREHRAGFVLLSTSRVYSLPVLTDLPLRKPANAFEVDDSRPLPTGCSSAGIAEDFSTAPPV